MTITTSLWTLEKGNNPPFHLTHGRTTKIQASNNDSGVELHAPHMSMVLPLNQRASHQEKSHQVKFSGNTQNHAKDMSGVFNSEERSKPRFSRHRAKTVSQSSKVTKPKGRPYTREPEAQFGLMYLDSTEASAELVGSEPQPK